MEATTTHQPEINAHDLVRYVHSSSSSSSCCNGSEHDQTAIPPGFRFHPTEEELVGYYLRRMLQGRKLPIQLIPTVDLYSFDPWELPAMAAPARYEAAECWYFFVPRSSKFPHGERPTRQTKSGYWKATGTDARLHAISRAQVERHDHELHNDHHDRHDHHHQYFSALRKTLVFYEGRAPRGEKTCWVMNEYRMDPSSHQPIQYNMIHPKNVDATICRLRLKRRMRPPANSTPAGARSFEALGSGEELHHDQGRPRPRADVNVSLHFASTSDNSTLSVAHPSNLHDALPCYYSTHGPLHEQTLSSHDVKLMDLDATARQENLSLSQSASSKSIMRPSSLQLVQTSACPDMRLLEACTPAPWMPSPGLAVPKGDNSFLSLGTLDDLLQSYDISNPSSGNQTN